MAKQIVILVICLSLLIFGGLWEIKYFEKSSRYLKTDIDYVRYELEKDNFDLAKNQLEEVKNTWNNISKIWNIFLNHERVDDLEDAIDTLDANIQIDDKEEAIKSNIILKSIVSQIVEEQKCSFERVF